MVIKFLENIIVRPDISYILKAKSNFTLFMYLPFRVLVSDISKVFNSH